MQNWAFTFYGVAYLSFSRFPFSLERTVASAPRLVAPCCRFRVSLYTALCASLVFPIIDVASRAAYALKMGSLVVGANLFGLLIYRLGSRAAARTTLEPSSGTS